MTSALWTFSELVSAAGGEADGAPGLAVTGFSIDTRTIAPGEVFVALKDQRDGHDFVTAAFAAGAAAAIVSDGYVRGDGDGALIRVADTLRALEAVGRAARARLSPEARVIAVTGSVGKTTTKDMLRAACAALGPTHASDKSYNNHWGVPLTLARMSAGTRYAVFEIGMNHAGEITPLTRLVRPHVALVTTVENAHIESFESEEGIADAKAEIFLGLEPGGTALINLDNRHGPRLVRAARAQGPASPA
jgi:UDP-N-acetylmuramoyl-tripeptide--D-alanyl-D-alanine ligase